MVGVQNLSAQGVDLAGRKSAAAKAPLAIDEWEFDQDLSELQSLLAAAKGRPTAADAPAPLSGSQAQGPLAPHAGAGRVQPRRRSTRLRSPFWTWLVLSLGVSAFIGGGALLALSYALERNDFWFVGMPLTVAGQVCLLLALVMQLERVWQGSRYAMDKLGEVDQRLADLSQTTTLLGVTHGSAAQAFYAHMAEGASPHLLLADLKGQIDLLAVRMSQRR